MNKLSKKDNIEKDISRIDNKYIDNTKRDNWELKEKNKIKIDYSEYSNKEKSGNE